MTAMRRDPLLHDPRHAADHLCGLVSPSSYSQYTLLVVTADSDSRPVHHIEVVDCSPDPSTSECAAVLDNLLAAVDAVPLGTVPCGLLLAVTRPGSKTIQSSDRVWFRAFHRVCHARGITALGFYIVGPHGARPVQIDDAA
jgi:hypothetical protein